MSGRFWLISILTFIAVMLFGVRVILPRYVGEKYSREVRKLKVGEQILTVEIASTEPQMEKGLGGRDFLAADSGMIFLYQREVVPRFWMKGMLFDIDIIWIQENTIVDLSTDVQASDNSLSELPFYMPKQPVTMVLEVNAGYVKKYNLKVGDSVFLL